jgi:hypothetical protein
MQGKLLLGWSVMMMVLMLPHDSTQPRRLIAGVSMAAAALTCSCPESVCRNGTVPGCSIECPSGQEAICVCAGFCGDDGNPSGMNRCGCQ